MKIVLALALLCPLLTGCGFVEGRDTPVSENATYVVRSRLTGAPKAVRYGEPNPSPSSK